MEKKVVERETSIMVDGEPRPFKGCQEKFKDGISGTSHKGSFVPQKIVFDASRLLAKAWLYNSGES